MPPPRSISSQSVCSQPQRFHGEPVRLVEGGRGEHHVTEPDAIGVEAAWHQCRLERRRRVGEAGDDLDPHAPRCGRRCQPRDAAGAPLRRGGVGEFEAGRSDLCGQLVEPRIVDGLEADERGIVRLARLDEESMSLAIVAPRAGVRTDGLAGHEADDLTEERVERRGVRDLDPQVGEFDVAVHTDNRTV